MPSKDSWGGPAASEPPFVDALASLGVEVVTETYVYGDKDKPTPFFTRIARVLRTAFRFRKLVRQNDFDLIFLNSAFDAKTLLRDSASLFIMRPGRAKVFLKIHGSLAHEFVSSATVSRFFIDYVKRNVDGFGVFTAEEREGFLRLGFDPLKLHRVKNSITIGSEIAKDFRRLQKESVGLFEILFVSRFARTKGLLETIRACALLKEKGVSFVLHCVGDGESRAEAEELVGALNLEENVKFFGYISEREVTKFFLNSDIFVFPTSHPEGFPMVLFKAAATGMPIVTTKIRAAADYFSEPENCLFCTNEPANIADRLAELMGDKRLREAMSVVNTEFGKMLSPEIVVKEYLKIFSDMLEKDLPPNKLKTER